MEVAQQLPLARHLVAAVDAQGFIEAQTAVESALPVGPHEAGGVAAQRMRVAAHRMVSRPGQGAFDQPLPNLTPDHMDLPGLGVAARGRSTRQIQDALDRSAGHGGG